VFAEPTCLPQAGGEEQGKWDERDPLDSWEQPMKTRHYHGVRKYLSEGAVSRVLSGYAALTRPTVEEEQEMLHPSVI
jgi:hypothetical protein